MQRSPQQSPRRSPRLTPRNRRAADDALLAEFLAEEIPFDTSTLPEALPAYTNMRHRNIVLSYLALLMVVFWSLYVFVPPQITVACLTNFAALCVSFRWSPFPDDAVDAVNQVALTQLFLTTFGALLLFVQPEEANDRAFFSALVVACQV